MSHDRGCHCGKEGQYEYNSCQAPQCNKRKTYWISDLIQKEITKQTRDARIAAEAARQKKLRDDKQLEKEKGGFGYHTKPIKKGQLFQASKIQEELDELVDAMEQGNMLMALCEIADIILAAKQMGELIIQHQLKPEDLDKMAEATRRAFEHGHRN